MYAVIETGGKQYRVELGSELAVERLEGAPGDTIDFDRVLLIADGDQANIGTPVVPDALVTASVIRQDRGEKVTVFKYRPKARHRSKRGHRQEQTVIRVADIRFGGRSAADEASAEQKEVSKTRRQAAAEAERKTAADKALAARLDQEAAERAAKEKPATRAKTAKTTTKSKAEAQPKAVKATAKAEPVTKAVKTASTAKAKAAPAPKAKAEPAIKAKAAKPSAQTAPAKKPSRSKKDE